MSEISDLGSRISAAMDRIGRGLEGLSAEAAPVESGPDEATLAELAETKAALETQKSHGFDLEARIEALTVERDALEKALEAARADLHAAEAAVEEAEAATAKAEAEALEATEAAQANAAEQGLDLDEGDTRETISQLGARLRRMRATSRDVRSSNQQMRAAMQAKLANADLVNQSMEAELNNLKAMRSAELAEMNVILSALRPMLGTENETKTEGDA